MENKCPKCNNEKYVKDGFAGGRQRYKCKECSYRFTVFKKGKRIDDFLVNLCLILYTRGMSFRGIEAVVGVSHVSVMRWVKEFGERMKNLFLFSSNERIEEIEIDEMWSFVQSKKKMYGSGLLLIAKQKGYWISR
jgi:transposase-like protein